uniref:Uncharacterized protein n=1 Tax=Mus musculus TaxID=10090 RepID=Q3TRN0_MOUSE|nr:unnamed protein product [Mus musculus]
MCSPSQALTHTHHYFLPQKQISYTQSVSHHLSVLPFPAEVPFPIQTLMILVPHRYGIPSAYCLKALGLHSGKVRFLLVSLTCLEMCLAQRKSPSLQHHPRVST